jgi:hypothetical protein
MDEKSAQVLVTVAALKLLVGRLLSLAYRQLQLNPNDVPEMHRIMLENWSKQSLVKSSDPAVSDVFSDEVLHEIGKILAGVEKDFAAMK